MKTKIFEYKGIIGAESDLENGTFINDVKGPGQMGIVVDVNEVEISKEAKDLIKTVPREGGSFAPIMITEHDDGSGSVALMGFWKHLFRGEDLCIGRDCDLQVLDLCTEIENAPPQDFKDFVDSL